MPDFTREVGVLVMSFADGDKSTLFDRQRRQLAAQLLSAAHDHRFNCNVRSRAVICLENVAAPEQISEIQKIRDSVDDANFKRLAELTIKRIEDAVEDRAARESDSESNDR